MCVFEKKKLKAHRESYVNMASNYQQDSEHSDESGSESSYSDSDFESVSDSQSCSDSDSDYNGKRAAQTTTKRNICKYYNGGHCHYGEKCRNEHICKYFAKGSCRDGDGCLLNHNPRSYASPGSNEHEGRKSHGRQQRRRSRDSSVDSEEDDGRPYRWQLNLGNGWEDVSNDYILEAQYSRPNTKGIKIFNTRAGVISIDFTKMRVLKKTNIRVRRKGSKQTEWLWYYQDDHGWHQYGAKVSKGKSGQIQSSKLEQEYQNNRRGSVQFSIDSHTYEISFKGMNQKNLSTNRKRQIRRRPKYEPSQTGILNRMTSSLRNLLSSSKNEPVWQFEGRSGKWYTFKNTAECSVSSDDIERCYQMQQNTMNFTVNGDTYTLDFSRMNQVNNKTNAKRKIRRA